MSSSGNNESEHGRWTYERREMIDVKFNVNVYCHETILDDIRLSLLSFGDEVFNKFVRSCFGHFLGLPIPLGKCMQVLHYVISRQMKFRNEDPSEVWFFINGTPIRFSRIEFALVTGLRFGGTSFTPYCRHAMPTDSFYTRVLNNKRILVSDLRDRFIRKDLGLLGEDYLKVAKILFVYNVLFGVERSKPKHISEWLWVLVENEKAWEKFPWGSYTFQKLLHFLKSIKKTTSSGTTKRESYTLFGFSTAFMAWIYCAIPEFGSTIGVVSSTTKIPRMLRFRYTRGNIDVADVKDEVYPKLEPNDEEKKRSFWGTIEKEGTPFHLHYDHSKDRTKRGRVQDSIVTHPPSDTNATTHQRPQRSCLPPTHTVLVPQRPPMVDSSSQHHSSSTYGPEDPIYIFTFSQRQALVHEIGDYVVSQLMTTDFVHRIGDYAADRVMSRIGDMLPRYTEFMSEERHTSDVQGGRDKNDERHVASDHLGHGSTPVEPLQNIIGKGDDVNGEKQMDHDRFEHGPTSVDPLENIIGNGDDERDIPEHHLGHGPTSIEPIENIIGESDDVNDYTNDFGGFHLESQWTQPNESSQLDATPADADIVKHDGNKTIPLKLDFTKVRRRVPSAALRSPFCPIDKRGENFDRFMRLRKHSKRNVGIGYCVTKEWFKEITNQSVQFEISMIDAYLSILYCKPEQLGLRKVDPKTTITSTSFMTVVRHTWMKYHPSEGTIENAPKWEGEIASEDLFELAKFVTGEVPNWGLSRPWFECDKVIMVANTSFHWVTCTINLLERHILIYDSLQHTFEDDDIEERRVFFTPLCEMLPLVLHYSDFYTARTNLVADMSPWSVKFPEEGNLYMQNDDINCGVYALKYAEAILTGKFEDSFDKKELKAFRKTMARRLFEFSTDESTIDTITSWRL